MARSLRREYNDAELVAANTRSVGRVPPRFGGWQLVCDSGSAMPSPVTTLESPPAGTSSMPEQAVRLRRGRADWKVRESHQENLLGHGSPDWFALEAEPRAVAVKRGHARTTWRITLEGGTVFAKVMNTANLTDRLRHLLLGDAAKREWRIARKAEARGVPVARCLAIAVMGGSAPRTVLLSEGVTDVVNLADAWQRQVEHIPVRQRRKAADHLIGAVARLFAQSHERGFVHDDAHPDNVLIAAPTPRPEALFVDVHSAKMTRRPASVSRTAESLAQLDQYFRRRATRTERLRFLHSYLTARGLTAGWPHDDQAKRRLLATLARAGAIRAHRLARHRDRRLRRNTKYFATFEVGRGWRVTAALELERRHLFPECEIPDRTRTDWQSIFDALVRPLSDLPAAGASFEHQGFSIEMNPVGGLLKRMFATLGWCAHRRAFERSHMLRHRDVPVDLILAYAEHRSTGLVDATMLIRPQSKVEGQTAMQRPAFDGRHGPAGD